METDRKDLESFPRTDDGIDDISNGTEYGDSAASPCSAISRNSEQGCVADAVPVEQEQMPDEGHELPNTNTSAATEVKPCDDGRQDSCASDLIAGILFCFAAV